MSGRTVAPQKPPVSKFKPPSEVEQRALKRQLECLAEDTKRICQLELHRPFASLADAVERLVPFHALSFIDGETQDIDDTPGHGGQNLVCSRQDVWLDHVVKKVAEATAKTETLAKRMAALEEKYEDSLLRTEATNEDKYVLAHFVVHDAREKLQQEQQANEARPS